ncbi:MAG: helicase C-terminal domain-containing protein [Pseudomonadales bacterium]
MQNAATDSVYWSWLQMIDMSLREYVIHCFGASGWLEKNQQFVHEPAQLAYALSVVDWLEGDTATPIGLIEGGAGVGKSLGYLVPLLYRLATTSERACLATHTLFLQDQLLDSATGDIAIAQEYLAASGLPPVRVEQLIGKQHFIDPVRLELMIGDLLEDGHTIDNHRQLVAGGHACAERDGRIESYLASHGPLPEGVDIHRCHVGEDTDINGAYLHQRESAKAAQLVVTSHVMLLLNRSVRVGYIFETDDAPMHHVVVDEADLLPKAADAIVTRRTRPTTIARTFDRLRGVRLRGGANKINMLADHCDTMQQALHRFIAGKTDTTAIVFSGRGGALETSIVASAKATLQVANTILKPMLKKRERLSHEQQAALDEAIAHQQFLEQYSGANSTASIGVSWSTTRKLPTLEISRAFPAERVKSYFLHRDAPQARVLFTSATLSNGGKGGFDSFKGDLQIFGSRFCATETMHEPAAFGACDYVLAPAVTPLPFVRSVDEGVQLSSRWLSVAAEMVQAAARGGPTLCLTVSHRETKALGRLIAEVPVYSHEPGTSLTDLVRELEGQGGVILSPCAWQGVSIRRTDGRQLFSNIVISRMPFVPPAPFWEQAMYIHFQNRGFSRSKTQSIMWGMLTVDVVRKLRQGFGRLIRKRDDMGTIWICDPRFKTADLLAHNRQARSLANAIPSRFYQAYLAAKRYDTDTAERIQAVQPVWIPEELAAWL